MGDRFCVELRLRSRRRKIEKHAGRRGRRSLARRRSFNRRLLSQRRRRAAGRQRPTPIRTTPDHRSRDAQAGRDAVVT